MESENKRVIFGVGWTTISTIITMLTQVLRLAILARFLEKGDFGVVALVNVVIGFCSTFADLGFSSVIMYKREIDKNEFSSLYWFQFIVFGALYIVILFASGLIAAFYNESTLRQLLPISGLSIIFLAIGKLYDSVLSKKYMFKTLAIRNILTNIISLLLAWLLAYRGYGVYSLILSTLFQLAMYNIWNLFAGFKLQPIGFVLRLNADAMKMLKMGLYQTYTRLLDFVSTKADVFIIGSFLGTEILGVYDLSKELVLKLVNLIKSIVANVALPFISNGNNDDNQVVSRFFKISKAVAYTCIPICLATAVFSNEIVLIMYGKAFIEATPIVTIFSIMTIFTSLGSFFDMLGIAKGRTDLNFYNTLVRVLVTVPVIWICCHFNIIFVAVGHLVLSIFLFCVMWNIIAKKTYNLSILDYISQFGKLALCLFAFSSCYFCLYNYACPATDVNLLLRGVIGGAVYGLMNLSIFYFLLKDEIKFLLQKNKK